MRHLRTLPLLALSVVGVVPLADGKSRLKPHDLIREGSRLLGSRQSKDETKLGRGLVSLALHMDPFVSQEQEFAHWLPDFLQKEPKFYWRGGAFVGHDKTYLESLFPRSHLFEGESVNFMGILTWRALQLVGLSCCGIDNMAVWLQQCNQHMYVAPFVDLAPNGRSLLKEENHAMYDSFEEWWDSTGRRSMPHPVIEYLGSGRYEWPLMKVAMKPSRVPVGWSEFIEVAIALKLEERAAAQTNLKAALRKNPGLMAIAREWLPEAAHGIAVPAVPSPAAADGSQKYIVCYNPAVGLGNLAVVMVSAHLLAKLTGRTLLLHWNVNTVSSRAFRLRQSSHVKLLPQFVEESAESVFSGSVKHLYFFHMMNSEKLGDVLELLGCQDLTTSLNSHKFVTISSNLYFAQIMKVNPTIPAASVPNFADLLLKMLAPSDESAKRALGFLRETGWGKADWWGHSTRVVAIHIRSREEGEDNDAWPTLSSPNLDMLDKLRQCLETAVKRDLKVSSFDIFVAATTEAARSAVVKKLKGMPGLRNTYVLKGLARDRRSGAGAVDAMAESLLISRADLFMRLVIGTSGFSTFAYMANALRLQNDWVDSMPWLKRSGIAPNYVVTEECGPQRCYSATPDVRMATIGWHGPQFTHRSCGDVVAKSERNGSGLVGCRGLRPVDNVSAPLGDEL